MSFLQVSIGDIAESVIDKSGPQGKEFIYIDISSIDRESKSIIDARVVDSEKAPSRAKQILKEGDVLVSMTRPNLNAVALIPSSLSGAVGSTGFHVIRPVRADPKFMFYLVQSRDFIERMCEKIQGALYPAVRPRDITSYIFNLPSSLEQQRQVVARIEELFSELDKGIESLKIAREQLKIYRQALLKHAFEGKLTEQWRKENADKLETPEQLLARIQQERQARYQQQLEEWKLAVKAWESNGKKGKKPGKPKELGKLVFMDSDLPLGWVSVSLEWLLTTSKKPMTTGPFGTALKKSEHQSSGVPVLGIENIGNGVFLPGNKIFVTEEKAKDLSSFRVYPEEIVISRSGTVGEVCEIPKDVENALISTNLLRVSLDSHVILSPFFVLMFQGGGVKLQVKELCKGSSREFLNQSILGSIFYPICGVEEQKFLLEKLETMFSVIDRQDSEIRESLAKVETLRQSILKKAFSGQLVGKAFNAT